MRFTNSWIEISRSSLIHNLKVFKKIIGPKVMLMPVVKSNAYGHGLVEVAKICDHAAEVFAICTVNLEEALALRQHKIKKPILVLSFYDLDKKTIAEAVKQKISLVVYREDQINFINNLAAGLKLKAKVHLKIDTGTSRLGALPADAGRFISLIDKKPYLIFEGLFSHYASAEEPGQAYTKEQTAKFYQLIQRLEALKIFLPLKHLACSAAILTNSDYHFDAVRLGLSLYGLWSLEDGHKIRKKYQLRPALSWKTRIMQIKQLPKNSFVGYGRTYRTKNEIRLAILPVGYWDGFDRGLSNQGGVLIGGKKCNVLGRVCMNLIMVNISETRAKVGDEAVLIGRQGRQIITADDLAIKLGTINYEVVTRLNPLIARKIVI